LTYHDPNTNLSTEKQINQSAKEEDIGSMKHFSKIENIISQTINEF
jgi:hypothetical protein